MGSAGAWGAASPRSEEGWNTGSLFDLLIVGWWALGLLPGRGGSALATEVDAPSSPGVLGMFPPKYFFFKEKQKLFFQLQPSEIWAGNTCEPKPAGARATRLTTFA